MGLRFLIKFLPLAILLLLIIWAGRGLFAYEFYYAQDFKHHLVRSYDAVITLSEGSFPLRWAGILNYECGVPMFNFYNPLLYYLAAVFYLFTGSLILSIKLISFLSLVVGGVFFYFWIWEESKQKWIAFGSSVLYIFAPYTFLLVYVRGSPEYISYAILPAVFYLYSKAFGETNKRRFCLFLFLGSVAGGVLALSHNVVFILVLPIILLYLLLKSYVSPVVKHHSWGVRLMLVLFSYISIVGFSAFFLFPAILEKEFTKLNTPIFDYRDHFPQVWQIINSRWEYGNSEMGIKDDHMSFSLGYGQWLVLGIGVIWVIVWGIRRSSKRSGKVYFILMFLGISLASLYLILPLSLPVWDKVPLLQQIQFSWRILGISVFALSSLFAYMLAGIKSWKLKFTILVVVAAISIVGNRNHITAQPVYENDLAFYRGLDKVDAKRRFLTANAETILAPNALVSCYFNTPLAETENQNLVSSVELARGSTHGKISINPGDIKDEKIILNLGYFPEIFDLRLNGQEVGYADCGGRICVDRNKFVGGNNEVSWRVGQTKLEKISNMVTLVFLGAWVFVLLSVRSKK